MFFEPSALATYQLKNKQTGQCADLYYGDSSPGTSLISYYCGTDLNMKWEFENVGGNAYRLINVKSHSCMTVASETSVSTKTVQIGWCEPSNFSYWEAISDKSGGVEFKNKSKGTCLAITNATPLTDLKLSACGQDSSTVWSMVGVVQ